MDRMPTARPDEARARIEFCTVSADRQLETALVADRDGRFASRAGKTDTQAATQCYAGDFFSPVLVAARPDTHGGS